MKIFTITLQIILKIGKKINFMKIINPTENLWFRSKSRLVPTIMMMFFCVLFSAQKKADLIVYNAKIYTVNQNFDIAEVIGDFQRENCSYWRKRNSKKLFCYSKN